MALNFTLICHADTFNPGVQSLQVAVHRSKGGGLHLRYELHGDLSKLRIPQLLAPAFADGLWRHSCFEAFLGVEGETAYREFNFSPSGLWAAYAFNDYRLLSGAAFKPQAPLIAVSTSYQTLRLEAAIAAADLPPPDSEKTLLLGLTAVLQARDGSLSYWALHHPSAQPDFHHRAGFVCKLTR